MNFRIWFSQGLAWLAMIIVGVGIGVGSITGQEVQNSDVEESVRQFSAELLKAFNSGELDQVVAMFTENGELIDEQGTVHSGRAEIKMLLEGFFERFPGSTMAVESESVRQAGSVIIDDGVRVITDANGVSSILRYTAVLVKTEVGWKIASLRDFPEESVPTSGELLEPLSWLIGEWVNEGSDGKVQISYRWSDDKNFILGDFVFFRDGQESGKSSQRIAWDPLLAKPRSWLFDSDGGFAEATWTEIESGWVIKSSAVMPDGQTGSATLQMSPESDSRFVLSGRDRVVGNELEEDYEIVVVKRPQVGSK